MFTKASRERCETHTATVLHDNDCMGKPFKRGPTCLECLWAFRAGIGGPVAGFTLTDAPPMPSLPDLLGDAYGAPAKGWPMGNGFSLAETAERWLTKKF